MNILLYAKEHSERGVDLKGDMQQVESLQSLAHCSNFDQLREWFAIPKTLPETVVFLAEDSIELQAFEEFRSRFDQVFLVLILPDTKAETVAVGHQLQPRFIAYHESDFADVRAVIEQHGLNRRKEQLLNTSATKPSYSSDWVK